MTKKVIDHVPQMLRSGRISESEAAWRVVEAFYRHPQKLGAFMADEDEAADFSLVLLGMAGKILAAYDETRSSFSTFLGGCISRAYKSWRKRKERGKIEEQTLLHDEKLRCESMADYWNHKAERDALEGGVEYKIRRNSLLEKTALSKQDILCVALKHCWELDDSLIEKIAEFAETDAEEFRARVSAMREKISPKVKKFGNRLISRNRQYHFHKKFMFEADRLDPSSGNFLKATRLYRIHTDLWHSQIRQTSLPAPTNRQICDMLDICERKVAYSIQRMKKISDEAACEPLEEELL